MDRAEERIEDHRGHLERMHLTSRDSPELYIEIVRFREPAPQDEYLSHTSYLERRFGSDSVTGLTESSLGEWPAWAYAFRGDDGERSIERYVLMVQVGRDTYRVIDDPRSELNTQVLATFAVVE